MVRQQGGAGSEGRAGQGGPGAPGSSDRGAAGSLRPAGRGASGPPDAAGWTGPGETRRGQGRRAGARWRARRGAPGSPGEVRTRRSPGWRAWAAALLTLALVAVGCGENGNGEAGQTPGADASPSPAAPGEAASLSIAANAVRGGKNSQEAIWIEDYVIPTFEQRMGEEGREVSVEFLGRGVDDEDFKAQIALDLRSGRGADVIAIDGIWLGEFVQAGFLEPLEELVGPQVNDWEGWDQIPEAVQANMSFQGTRYGIPAGTDGRVLFYNKDLFEQAGLPRDWQPTSWIEVLEAARTLKQEFPDVVPLQINAGTAMGEATTMQGFLPLLAAVGAQIYDEESGKWLGDTPELRRALELYADIYREEPVLGDPELQIRQDGRDRSFQDFAEGRIAVLAEGDYFWRSVVNPDEGIAPMENRNEVVGWAKIPAVEPGAAIRGQSFVSMSGGGGRVLNPNTDHPELAWELLAFMNSKEAVLEFVQDQPRITQRSDVNEEILGEDPLLSFVAEEVLPVTAYRPGLANYPQVSVALQQATEAVVTGSSPEEAAQAYHQELESIVGAENVQGG